MIRTSWNGVFATPDVGLRIWSKSARSSADWSNPEYDTLLARAAESDTTDERYRLLQLAESMLVSAAPFVPVAHYTQIFLEKADC